MNESFQLPSPGEPVGQDVITRLIPHRYPFLLVDRLSDWSVDPVKRAIAIKNVTVNEPFFQGHFPGHPVMPGVLIIEAMAQAAGVLGALAMAGAAVEGQIYYLVKIDNARFSQIVVPGDQLVMDVTEVKRKRNMGIFSGVATVDGKKVASADIMCASKN